MQTARQRAESASSAGPGRGTHRAPAPAAAMLHPQWTGRVFASLQELREELDRFAKLYNERWLVQKHGHKTPNLVRAEQNKRALDEGADPLIEGAA